MTVKINHWHVIGFLRHGDASRNQRLQVFVVVGVRRPIGERLINARLQPDMHRQASGGEAFPNLRDRALKTLSNRKEVHDHRSEEAAQNLENKLQASLQARTDTPTEVRP